MDSIKRRKRPQINSDPRNSDPVISRGVQSGRDFTEVNPAICNPFVKVPKRMVLAYYYSQTRSLETSLKKQKKELLKNIQLFQALHERYPSHEYRWLNAKLRLETGQILSDAYAHKCCKIAGIKSESKHYRYKKPSEPHKTYPNLLLQGIAIDGPMQCIVSDMTTFRVKGVYYELTLYMDLWNNEIVAHALSGKRGDRMTYISGLRDVPEFKKRFPNQKMILHSDQGSVYSSKECNELLPMYSVERSMSRAGTPTDNASMEAINGWIKAELFMDFHITSTENVKGQVSDYIREPVQYFL